MLLMNSRSLCDSVRIIKILKLTFDSKNSHKLRRALATEALAEFPGGGRSVKCTAYGIFDEL